MEIYYDDEQESVFHDGGPPRSHPWEDGVSSGARYVSFVTRPDLIEETLEDFRPFGHLEPVKKFYDLLRHANRPNGLLETNHCELRPVRVNTMRDGQWPDSRYRSDGRLMFLFRDWRANTIDRLSRALLQSMWCWLESYRTEDRVIVGMYSFLTVFPSLPNSPRGRETVVHWWTWGDSESETWDALGTVSDALKQGVDQVERRIRLDHAEDVAQQFGQ